MSRPDWRGDLELEREDADDRRVERDEIEGWESDLLAEVPTWMIDLLAEGNEHSLIAAYARARRGAVRS